MRSDDAKSIAGTDREAAQIAALVQVAKMLILEAATQRQMMAEPLLKLGWRMVQSHCAACGVCEQAVLSAMRRIEASGKLGSSAH